MTSSDQTMEQLEAWMRQPEEHERLEFKEAHKKFNWDRLIGYCVALANEGGGKLILGVSDRPPRKIVDSRAFLNLEKVKGDLTQALRVIRVDATEIFHPDGRVVVFAVPSRPLGMPLDHNGRYLMRSGESLTAMTQDRLRSIFDEVVPDFSAEIVDGATLSSLDSEAIEIFRERWIADSGNEELRHRSNHQLLSDAGLVSDQGVTVAAIVLLGRDETVRRNLAQSEIIYEYRLSDSSIRTHQRSEFRRGFLLILDELWNLVSLRNDTFHFQDGPYRREIPAFREEVVREAVLNAVAHRDYRFPGSVFIRQFPGRLEIESPGGLPQGITQENIVWRREPRNRLIAETLERCGLVERSGQGMDIMFRRSIEEGKLPPDFSGTDEHLVHLTLSGQIQDPRFIEMLEAVAHEVARDVTVDDLIVLDHIHRERTLPQHLRSNLQALYDNGIIERIGRGRGTRYLLSRRFYKLLDEPGAFTRKHGLDRDTNKQLLLKHIQDNDDEGSRFRDLHQVLPGLSRYQIQTLLRELKVEQKIHNQGVTRAARWYAGKGLDTV